MSTTDTFCGSCPEFHFIALNESYMGSQHLRGAPLHLSEFEVHFIDVRHDT